MVAVKNSIRRFAQSVWKAENDQDLAWHLLDPNLAKSFKRLTMGFKSHWLPPKLMRASYRFLTTPFNQIAPKVTVNNLSGPRPIRHYQPATPSRHSMVYFHGGGFVIGDLSSHDTLCRLICENANINVFAVHYRLAPEHKFPTPVSDCILSYNWIHSQLKAWGLDPDSLGVGGDSAGATASMVIEQSFHLESKFLPKTDKRPKWLWLMYPLTTMETEFLKPETERMDSFLSLDLMAYFKRHYLPKYCKQSQGQSNQQLWEVAPKFGDWHRDTNITLITVDHDPLTAGTLSWLNDLKFEVNHLHFNHLYHEFISMGGVSDLAKKALDQSIDAIKKMSIAN